MVAKQDSINLLQFQDRFATEEACHEHLFNLKWPEGYSCPKCGHTRYYETKTRRLTLYECVKCRYQSTVTVNTVMEKSRTNLRIWFWAIYLVSRDKRGVSAKLLSKELGISCKTAWLMLHKIRHAMGKRDSQYFLAGIVELDDTFFGAPTEGGKRGRGTEKTNVLAGLSLSQQGHPLYLKMKVVEDLKGMTLNSFALDAIRSGTIVSTDLYSSYKTLAKEGYQHEPKEFNVKDNPDQFSELTA